MSAPISAQPFHFLEQTRDGTPGLYQPTVNTFPSLSKPEAFEPPPVLSTPHFILFHPSEITRKSWGLLLKKIFPKCRISEAASLRDVQFAGRERDSDAMMMEFHPATGSDHGVETLKAAITQQGGRHVLLICGPPAHITARTAMQAGASIFIGSNESVEELKRAMCAALEGVPYMSSELAAVVACSAMPSGSIDEDAEMSPFSLSAREEEVLNLLVSGMRPSQVASRLGLSMKTISSHKRNALGKLGVTSILEAVRLWV